MRTLASAQGRDEVLGWGPHWSYGWLRRPELDLGDGYTYEQPSGEIVVSTDPMRATRAMHPAATTRVSSMHKDVLMLNLCLDEEGERYLCVSPDLWQWDLKFWFRRP